MFRVNLPFAIVLTAFFSVGANAQSEKSSPVEYCKKIENLAGSIIRLRQMGMPMSELMNSPTDATARMANAMIEKAYRMPKYPESMLPEIEVEFKNEAFRDCYSAVKK